jgi:hypothetical protein
MSEPKPDEIKPSEAATLSHREWARGVAEAMVKGLNQATADKAYPRIEEQIGVPVPDDGRRAPYNVTPSYTVSSFDNFHFGDEDEGSDEVGTFATAEEAIAAARAVVDKSLRYEASSARSAESLADRWSSFGDSPSIRGTPTVEFSAWEYAKERAPQIFAEEARHG